MIQAGTFLPPKVSTMPRSWRPEVMVSRDRITLWQHIWLQLTSDQTPETDRFRYAPTDMSPRNIVIFMKISVTIFHYRYIFVVSIIIITIISSSNISNSSNSSSSIITIKYSLAQLFAQHICSKTSCIVKWQFLIPSFPLFQVRPG